MVFKDAGLWKIILNNGFQKDSLQSFRPELVVVVLKAAAIGVTHWNQKLLRKKKLKNRELQVSLVSDVQGVDKKSMMSLKEE